MQRSNWIFVIDNTSLVKGKPMGKAGVVFSAAAVTVMTAVSIPTPVEARGGWGWGPGIAGGLIGGALFGGFCSRPCRRGPWAGGLPTPFLRLHGAGPRPRSAARPALSVY